MAIDQEGMRLARNADSGINVPPAEEEGIMDSPGLEGSFQQLLADNLGHYVQIDFLVGVQTLVRRSGIIYAVGRSFVVLYDPTNRNFVMCDVFSAKFVAFFAQRPQPGVLPNNPMGIMEVDARGNIWPVEEMERPANVQTGAAVPGETRVTAQQLVDAQQRALDFARQLQQQSQTGTPVQTTPGIPHPGWVTLGDVPG